MAWFDARLKQIDNVLAVNGDDPTVLAQFTELGMKVKARRAEVIKLDARTIIGPRFHFVNEDGSDFDFTKTRDDEARTAYDPTQFDE